MAQQAHSEQPSAGFLASTIILMLVGLAGLVVAGFSTTFSLHGGCAMGGVAAMISLVFALLFLGWLGLIAILAAVGVFVVWRHQLAGAALILAANLLLMGSFVIASSEGHQVGWDVAILIAAAMPAVVGGLAAWRLLRKIPTGRDRVIGSVAVILVAAPMLYLYGSGLSRIAADAYQPAVAVPSGCGTTTSG
jgi:hypothetical protein